AIEKSFQDNFARFSSLFEIYGKRLELTSKDESLVENHSSIDSEEDLSTWNSALSNSDIEHKYLTYFSKIIIPNSYNGNGDNACYTAVDCLFTRNFWNQFTWTGINRGAKSKRGFREFGNVTQLILKIVQIGDPLYTAQKLEAFCKTRLFRYAKARSSNKQLRRSACRPERKLITKKILNQTDSSILVQTVHTAAGIDKSVHESKEYFPNVQDTESGSEDDDLNGSIEDSKGGVEESDEE
ncbi:uncharacterized protein LOC129728223, partial [Wyeomyia smithii]|uniref:uncharacterized protein LOC129728223 n=1 Tax=Wyeomyia smithii TaxID=174621 RepID=UPI002467E481